MAAKEQSEIDVIQRFLQKQMSAQEVDTLIKSLIEQTGASGMKDMGKIMGVLKAQYAGQLDFGAASGVIKKLLS